MTWLWGVLDMDLRVEYARAHSPVDFYTLLARWVISRTTSVLYFGLRPLDIVLRLLGPLLERLVFFGHLFLLILTGLWWPIWAMLVYGSRLWLERPWSRPILLFPGVLVSVFAFIFIMLVPDHLKTIQYTTLSREWPLTWMLWNPPEEYVENSEFFEGDEYIGDGTDPYALQ